MVPAGREYDPLTRTYFNTDKKPEPQDARPWRRLEGDAPEIEDAGDQRAEDVTAALAFFGKEDQGGDAAAPGGVLADVGCGDGYMARRLLRSGLFDAAFALDVDWRQLEAARAAAEEDRLNPESGLHLFRGDAQALPFREGSVDAAWWGMGMHKVQDAAATLKSVAAALRPGGRLLATTISSILPGRGPEDIKRKAQEAGFSEVSVEQPRESEIVLRAVK